MTAAPTLQQQTSLAISSVRSPEMLWVKSGASISYGASQVWYPSWLQRMSGCGPTAASNLLWYLAATRPESCGALFAGDGTKRADMVRLMQRVWQYVTPGMRGVDKASMLAEGGVQYGADNGIIIRPRVLEIPAADSGLYTDAVFAFLSTAFADDLPVAFLNLSNGALANLESWHWVTLIAANSALCAQMYDQGGRQMLDLDLWLQTTKKGGAFVVLEPA
ncbi:MAG: hypothetical protein ACOYJB_07815 [Christensenellaceae bacterium]|jgi:hypothetical protein